LRNALVIVTLSGLLPALLSACTGVPPVAPPAFAAPLEPLAQARPASSASAAVPDDVAAVLALDAQADEAALRAKAEEQLPGVPMSKELLYTLMKAEFEAKSGQWQGPYATMMTLARQTRDARLAKRAAELALGANQVKESIAAVGLWRELAPDSEDAEQYQLTLSVMADDLSEAATLFAARLREASAKTRPVAMLQIRQILARAKDKVAALALFDRLLAPYADMVEARVLLSQNAFLRGDTAAAITEARAALALDPRSELATLTLAQTMTDQAALTSLLEAFVKANPNGRDVRLALGRLYGSQKRYPAARAQLEVLLAQQPDNPTVLYALGVLAMQLNDRAAVEAHFTRYIAVAGVDGGGSGEQGGTGENGTNSARVLATLAELAEERGDFKAAAAWLEKIPADDGELHFAAQLRRARLAARQGDLAAGQALLAGMAPEAPERQAQLVMTEGQMLRAAGKTEAAYTVLAAGAKRFPANADLLYDYALLAEATGRNALMESALRTVMAKAPDNHHAYNALGYSLAERNVRLPEALTLIAKAMKMAPDDPFIMDSMGWVQYRLGKLDLAEQHLRRAYALRNDADIAAHLGEVLWKQGKADDARKLWREANARDPNNATLRSTLARLRQQL